jgi:hypothetical protein
MLLTTLIPNVLSSNNLQSAPPYTPSNPYPGDGATDVSIFVNLSWTGGDPEGDNVTYDIYFGMFNPPQQIISNQSGTIFDPGFLEFNVTYFWQIVSWDENGETAPGPIWSFTTRSNSPPNIPLYPDPPSGVEGVTIFVILSWTGGDPDGDNVTYDIYFGESSPPPKVVDNQTLTSYNPGTLEWDTKYYWRIIAWDEFEYPAKGSEWNFTTRSNEPPYIPSNPVPDDGAMNIVVETILEWDGGDPDGDPVTYDIYLGITNPPPLHEEDHIGTIYEPEKLEYNTTYYWKIIAFDQFNTFSEGPIWSFTTEKKVNKKPIRPTISGVKGVHIPNRNYDYEIVTTDPDGDPVLYYIDWGDGDYLYWFGPFDSGENVTRSHSWPPITKIYEIQVKAKDIYGAESNWGTMYVFVLNNRPSSGSIIQRFVVRIFEKFPIFERIFGLGRLFNLY